MIEKMIDKICNTLLMKNLDADVSYNFLGRRIEIISINPEDIEELRSIIKPIADEIKDYTCQVRSQVH